VTYILFLTGRQVHVAYFMNTLPPFPYTKKKESILSWQKITLGKYNVHERAKWHLRVAETNEQPQKIRDCKRALSSQYETDHHFASTSTKLQ
jgi:hypothetical protein